MKLISLTQGQFAIVDDCDYEYLSQFKWYAYKQTRSKTYYARRNMSEKTIQMHRLILNAKPGELCDHINRNGLDNRRSNLRICTHFESVINRDRCRRGHKKNESQSTGVFKKGNKFQVYFRRKYLGLFNDELTASMAYEKLAKEYYG